MKLWPFRRGGASAALGKWDLSQPLLSWSRRDAWTIRDAVAGSMILGSTGSGKSSGSGKHLAHAFLRSGFGGLVLTAKADERHQWERYCQATGREDDLIAVDVDGEWVFNALDYEVQRSGAGAGITENLVRLLDTLVRAADQGQDSRGGREGDSYWQHAYQQLTRNAIDLLVLATGKVSVSELYRAVISAPTTANQVVSENWQRTSLCHQLLKAADKAPKTAEQRADFGMVADYFLLEFPNLSSKTRSVIVSTFTSITDVLARGKLRRLLCEKTTITPEAVGQGKILIIDLPVKEFGPVGLIAQAIWKFSWQRAIERRAIANDTRPVFLWIDEYQNFADPYDMQFATTCRGARVALTLLTQNINNLEAAFGIGEKGKAQAASLLGNLNTKIMHANSDAATNQWAAQMIGRSRQHFANSNASHANQDWAASAFGFAEPGQRTAGVSEHYEYELQPNRFSELRTGGPDNGWQVDAVLFQSGKLFAETGRTWMPVTFDQRSS